MVEPDLRSIPSLKKKSNVINIVSNYTPGSIIANYTATSQNKLDKSLKISFIDVLNKTTGGTINIPVDIFIETNQTTGSIQYVLDSNYNELNYTNTFSGITFDTIGRTKYDFTHTGSSVFNTPSVTPTPSITPSATPSVTPSVTSIVD